MPGIGLITNPRARTNKKDPTRMRRLGYLLGSRGLPEATSSLDDLQRVAEEFCAAGIEILGINGGDGTIGVTLTAFIKAYQAADRPLPVVAILRGGTMNTIANSMGITGAPSKLLYDILDRYHNREPFTVYEREVLQVGDNYGFIFGNGVIHNYLKAYYGTGKPSPTMAGRVLLRAALSAAVRGRFARDLARRVRARVWVDGEEWAVTAFTTIAAAVVEQIGLGFKPFYRTNERPGTFAVLGIHTSALGVVLDLPRLYRARPMRRDKVVDAVAQEVILETDGPVGYTLDGDNYEASGQLRLTLGPRLRFIVPDDAPERFRADRLTVGETDAPVDGPPTDGPPTDQPTDGPPADQPTDGPPTDGPPADQPTQEASPSSATASAHEGPPDVAG